jgi:hypothetical protein
MGVVSLYHFIAIQGSRYQQWLVTVSESIILQNQHKGYPRKTNDNKMAVCQQANVNITTNLHRQVSELTSSSALYRSWLNFRIQILPYLPHDHDLDHHAKKAVLYGTVAG